MGLRIVCKAKDLMAYMKRITSKLGKDCKVIDINYILSRKVVNLNE